MFERRLRNLLLAFAGVLAVLTWRLIELQVVRADEFREQAELALRRRPTPLPFVRGRIVDRFGHVLAGDEPCWQIEVDYAVISGAAVDDGDIEASEVGEMWTDLAAFAGEPEALLNERAGKIVDQVERWRRTAAQRRGFDLPIREEQIGHRLVGNLDDQQQVRARERFSRFPWVQIQAGTRRVYAPHASLGHVLGQLAPVTAEQMRDAPEEDDPLARYLPSELAGNTGLERAAEQTLRGRRGLLQLNRRDEVVEHVPPVAGDDVAVTLHTPLQAALYELLASQIPALAPYAPGGAVVVLDVSSREVLALVSYPGYDAAEFHRRYDELLNDTRRTPLRFRAVASAFEPGSIVKPLTCLAGLGTGAITTESTFRCTGYLFDDDHSRLRCWPITGTSQRKAHGVINVEEAIGGSCNVFMYHVAERVGVGGLTDYGDFAGVGRSTGVGLIEERSGINPTPRWLQENRAKAATVGVARNLAIGQGEMMMTPLQAANLAAVYAGGHYRAVQLLRDGSDRPASPLPVASSAWDAVRAGLYRVTNDPNGTAYKDAHWENEHYVLCGKTGSATTFPTPTAFRIRYDDARGVSHVLLLPAKTARDAIDACRSRFPEARFDVEKDVFVESYWPPNRELDKGYHSHAWFAGYLASRNPRGGFDRNRTPPVAFALIVEFGGSGGHTGGPIARQVAQTIYDVLGPNLDADTSPGAGTP